MTKRQDRQDKEAPALTRRGLFLGAAAGGLGAALPGAAHAGSGEPMTPAEAMSDAANPAMHLEYPFYSAADETAPQAGIETPPQRYTMFMSFDLTTRDPRDLQILLARWSAAIGLLMKGRPVGQVEPERTAAVGLDTGEALDLGTAALTVTLGLGPRVFGPDFGLADKRPSHLRELETLPSDALRPGLRGGDLSLQACAEDPQVAYHAIRDLARIAKRTGAAATRWTQMGFGRASAGKGQETPRNLFGFRDGTRNIREAQDFNQHVWVENGPDWSHGGTYQVVRKIEMHIENWDNAQVSVQNAVFGRHKVTGAPLTGQHEFDAPDFARRDAAGSPVIPVDSHMRQMAHEENDGVKILRRSYNYTDGLNAVGRLDAGLLFVSYQNDPAHFERLQRRLGTSDALGEYVSHIGSGVFFVPPAPKEGSYIGAELFG